MGLRGGGARQEQVGLGGRSHFFFPVGKVNSLGGYFFFFFLAIFFRCLLCYVPATLQVDLTKGGDDAGPIFLLKLMFGELDNLSSFSILPLSLTKIKQPHIRHVCSNNFNLPPSSIRLSKPRHTCPTEYTTKPQNLSKTHTHPPPPLPRINQKSKSHHPSTLITIHTLLPSISKPPSFAP